MATRTEQLQIRVTPAEKEALKARARAAGVGVSRYVLSRVLPDGEELAGPLDRVGEDRERRFALAEFNDVLSGLGPATFGPALANVRVGHLPPLWQNYVAAMVEVAADRLGVAPPDWTASVTPLDEPYFATASRSLRLYLMRVAPVAFRRRNLFVDASIGDRI